MAENPYYSILKIVAPKALAAINFPFLPKLFLLQPIAFSYQNRDFFSKENLTKVLILTLQEKILCSHRNSNPRQSDWLLACFLQLITFFLLPSAKDQGITWVFVVLLVLVLLHLVHFLIKRNLRGKNSPLPGSKPGTSRSTVWHSTNWAKETLLFRYLKIIYLFQKSRRRPCTSIGRHLFPLRLPKLTGDTKQVTKQLL